MKPRHPERKRLVLIGGGHSHLAVLEQFGKHAVGGVQLTLIAKELNAPYSGMLPGLIAGDYSFDQCHVDLTRLGKFAGVRVIHGEVEGIDPVNKRLHLREGRSLGYDLLSLDVGITPDTNGISGADKHTVPVKPISSFHPAWMELLDRCLEPAGPRRLAVIGGGAAGYELVLAMRSRILREAAACRRPTEAYSFVLLAGGELLSSLNGCARRLARRELARAKVTLVENDPVIEATASELVLASGKRLDCDAAVLCTQGKAAAWFGDSGLPLDEKGYFAVRPTLQSCNDENVFAVGDCAAMIGQQRPKAGVFAVRQGPYLAENLRRLLRGEPLLAYRPQERFLMLLSNSRKSAIAARGPFALRGRLMWLWKDRIDRHFMHRFQQLPSTGNAASHGKQPT